VTVDYKNAVFKSHFVRRTIRRHKINFLISPFFNFSWSAGFRNSPLVATSLTTHKVIVLFLPIMLSGYVITVLALISNYCHMVEGKKPLLVANKEHKHQMKQNTTFTLPSLDGCRYVFLDIGEYQNYNVHQS
jgi:hypothetical protein